MKNKHFILILILSAFLLRFVGIFDGLPAAYNSTEYFLTKTALSMGARQSLDPLIYIYSTLYEYYLLLLYITMYFSGIIVGVFKNTTDFALQFLIDPSVFYLMGRITNVLISVLTVIIFYRQTRNIFGEITARFAATIAGLSYYFIQFSQYAVADTTLILFSTIATLSILQAYFNPLKKNYLRAGIFTGLAIGTKYNAGFLILPLLLVLILNWNKHEYKSSLQNGIILSISLLTGFLIFNPLWIIKFSDFFDGFKLIYTQMNSAVSLYHGINYIWEIIQIVSKELLIGVGFFIGSIYCAYKRKPSYLILLVPMLITFLYVGSWQKKGIDYLFAVFPSWILMFSIWLAEVWRKLEKRQSLKFFLGFILFTPSLLMSIYHNVSTLNPDTREQATMWIMHNVGKGDKITYDHYTFDLGLFDVHRFTEYGAGANELPDIIKERVLNYIDHPRNVSNIPIQFKRNTRLTGIENSYDVELAQYGRKSLTELQEEGVTYLITNSWFYQPYFEMDINNFTPLMRKRISNIREFYQKVAEVGKKIKVFQPDFWKPGPLIELYDISKKK